MPMPMVCKHRYQDSISDYKVFEPERSWASYIQICTSAHSLLHHIPDWDWNTRYLSKVLIPTWIRNRRRAFITDHDLDLSRHLWDLAAASTWPRLLSAPPFNNDDDANTSFYEPCTPHFVVEDATEKRPILRSSAHYFQQRKKKNHNTS